LGDLPALRPRDLDAALEAAAGHPRAFVPDAEGDGTTLVTAVDGKLVTAFGPGSAAAHERLGLVRLDLDSTVRRDVDDPGQLAAARALGLGPRTRELDRG
ncbi:MAG TPA: 2-phospho-L-lactate guanylyltransferase, partial [Rhodoglobus sp.]|nr:2-phospho-L-lactate guanylyltransferase [Rhodoglobus sp.]